MKTYKTVNHYLKQAEPNDRIILSGKGIMDGIKHASLKYDTFKVIEINNDNLILKAYQGKKRLKLNPNAFDQRVGVLTKNEFQNLKT
jgi:hypothetical protein